MNALVIGAETDFRDEENDPDWETLIWIILGNFFCVVWVFEFVCRFYFYRFRYFLSGWNLLDFFLVVLSVSDACVMPLTGSSNANMKSLSVLRMARMLRLARVIRLMRAFKELSGFIAALKTLSWVMLLIVIVLYTFGILMTILVG